MRPACFCFSRWSCSKLAVFRQRQTIFLDIVVLGADRLGIFFQPATLALGLDRLGDTVFGSALQVDVELAGLGEEFAVERKIGGFACG